MLQPDNPVRQLKLPAHKVSAWVEIGGNKVNVFDTNTDGSLASGFIESNVGQEFVLCYKLEMTSAKQDLSVLASADGSKYLGHVYSKRSSVLTTARDSPYRIQEMQGTQVGECAVRRLKFIPMNYSDNASIVCRNEKILRGIGSIKLEFINGRMGRRVTDPDYYKGPVDLSPFHRAHRAELENDHRVALGELEDDDDADYYDFAAADHDGHGEEVSFASFVFYYRSANFLWRHRVRSPTAPSSHKSGPHQGKEDSLLAKVYDEYHEQLMKARQEFSADPLVD